MSADHRYEERPCFRCDRGTILHADDPMARPKRTPCPHCKGTGHVTVYLYPKLKRA
jgi:hypothetical protein